MNDGLEVVFGTVMHLVGIGTEINGTWMVVVEFGIVVLGGVYKRFPIWLLRTFAKMSNSFRVEIWDGGTTCKDGEIDTYGVIKVGIISETTFCTWDVSALSSSMWTLSPRTTLRFLSSEFSPTTAAFDFFDFSFVCD